MIIHYGLRRRCTFNQLSQKAIYTTAGAIYNLVAIGDTCETIDINKNARYPCRDLSMIFEHALKYCNLTVFN